jgi:hypothetical protein
MGYHARNHWKEFAMTTYLPALVWSLSSIVCLLIARQRNVRVTAPRAMLAALVGPIAIPYALAARPSH